MTITPNNILIQERLERQLLHGLSCEWENAFWLLNASHRKKLKRPIFSLQDMASRWGYWSGKKNEICLSRKLLSRHSWAAVRGILLHEMAHQIAEQVLCIRDETSHGQGFRDACNLLKADPKSSENFKPLDDPKQDSTSLPEDRILIRVRKLMSLAQSPNQYEAESAMTKAHELISKHNIDLISKNGERQFVSVFVGQPALRHFRDVYHLSGLLQKFYFIYGIWVPAYVLAKGRMGRVLEITGTRQNIRIAAYVHDFIVHFIELQWREYNKDKKLGRHHKTDFAVGIIEGFSSKLKLQEKKTTCTAQRQGLVRIQDPLLKKHAAWKYPRTAHIKSSASEKDPQVLNDGFKKGRDLIIHKGISEKGSDVKLLNDSRPSS